MITDLHSHILPSMDDGSQSVEESISILREMTRQGVDRAVASPHFYLRSQEPSQFLAKRRASLSRLCAALPNRELFPPIIPGAEVQLAPGLCNLRPEEIEALKIGTTDFLLLELPYYRVSAELLDEVDRMIWKYSIRLIVAHPERSALYAGFEAVQYLIDRGCVLQLNADSLFDPLYRQRVDWLFDRLAPMVMGSDAHNLTGRPVGLQGAYEQLTRLYGERLSERIRRNSAAVADNLPPAALSENERGL